MNRIVGFVDYEDMCEKGHDAFSAYLAPGHRPELDPIVPARLVILTTTDGDGARRNCPWLMAPVGRPRGENRRCHDKGARVHSRPE